MIGTWMGTKWCQNKYDMKNIASPFTSLPAQKLIIHSMPKGPSTIQIHDFSHITLPTTLAWWNICFLLFHKTKTHVYQKFSWQSRKSTTVCCKFMAWVKRGRCQVGPSQWLNENHSAPHMVTHQSNGTDQRYWGIYGGDDKDEQANTCRVIGSNAGWPTIKNYQKGKAAELVLGLSKLTDENHVKGCGLITNGQKDMKRGIRRTTSKMTQALNAKHH